MAIDMSRGPVLDFLANWLTVGGSDIMPTVYVAALAKIESVLDEIGFADPTALNTAILAAFAPEASPEDVRARFGDATAQLFTRFVGTPYHRSKLLTTAARAIGEPNDPLAAGTALAIIAAELAMTVDPDERTGLRRLAETALNSAVDTVRKVLEKLLKALPEASEAPTGSSSQPIWLLSVSIDIAASTEAKTRLHAVAADDDSLKDSYRTFYRQFLNHEDRFYRCLFDGTRTFKGSRLDWRKIFVVKGIGDEVWLLYEMPSGELDQLKAASARLLDAALILVNQLVQARGTEKSHGPALNAENELNQRADGMELPYKVYIDLITDAFEIAKLRAESIENNVGFYLGASAGTRFGPDHVLLANRLNAGFIEISGRRRRRAIRTDFIGHQIDRFFRTSKAAIPATVTIGEALFHRIGFETKLTAYPGLFRATIKYPADPTAPGSVGGEWSEILYRQTDTPAEELKGIGYSYRNYHMTTLLLLRALHNWVIEPHVLAPTYECFPRGFLQKMKTLNEQEATEEGDMEGPETPEQACARRAAWAKFVRLVEEAKQTNDDGTP